MIKRLHQIWVSSCMYLVEVPFNNNTEREREKQILTFAAYHNLVVIVSQLLPFYYLNFRHYRLVKSNHPFRL